RADRGEDR
ncbi:hypothetical protein BIW11_04861, partial [Tropilaelaps mercedesae]